MERQQDKQLKLQLLQHTFDQVEARWEWPWVGRRDFRVKDYDVTVTNKKNQTVWTQKVQSHKNRMLLPLRFEAGQTFYVEVRANALEFVRCQLCFPEFCTQLVPRNVPVADEALFRAVYTRSDLKQLLGKAEAYMHTVLSQRTRLGLSAFKYVDECYRDKSFNYWEEVAANNNVMEVYQKDKHGDQASPINDFLQGLFFNVNVDSVTEQIPTRSIFGTHRLRLPTQDLFDEQSALYLADFYCIKPKTHYVTLVLADRGSKQDLMCQMLRLAQLDIRANWFLRLESDGGASAAFSAPHIWIEVLFMHNLDLSMCLNTISRVRSARPNSHKRSEHKKNVNCPVCNIR